MLVRDSKKGSRSSHVKLHRQRTQVERLVDPDSTCLSIFSHGVYQASPISEQFPGEPRVRLLIHIGRLRSGSQSLEYLMENPSNRLTWKTEPDILVTSKWEQIQLLKSISNIENLYDIDTRCLFHLLERVVGNLLCLTL